jgi:hypothetical protein
VAVLINPTPHFDLPFRFVGSTAATVEQDTEDDVANCVLASVLTHSGQRPESPNFGAGDITFRVQPVDLNVISEKVVQDEPRAAVLLSQIPSMIDSMIANIEIQVALKGSA